MTMQKNWALIVNGTVAETTYLDPTCRYHPDLQWAECPVETQTSCTYNGQAFDPPMPYVTTVYELCAQVAAADAARHKVAGDPLRSVEYDRAESEAAQYQAAGFTGEVPPMAAAWVTPSRDAQASALDILAEAKTYTSALVMPRTNRLQAKEQIRALMVEHQSDRAKVLAEQTVSAIKAAVAGIKNNSI